MKKFLKFLLIVIIALLVIVLAGALFLPKETVLEESVVIKASPEVIFDYVNCLEKTSEWAPWENVSDVKFSGPACGVGAIQEWKDDMGTGKQEIIESVENEYSKTALDFGQQGTAEAVLKLEKTDDGTKVTWTFNAEAGYPMGRWFGLIMIKPMLKESYKKGLQNLDSLIMSLPPETEETAYDVPTVIDVLPKTMLSVRETVTTDQIGPKMGEHYGMIGQFIGMNKLKMNGYPICIWHNFNDDESDMECGMFIEGEAKGNESVKVSKSYEGKAVVLDYFGAYDASPDGWQKIEDYIRENQMEKNGTPWDEYYTDPNVEPDTAKWHTRLYQPVK